MCERAVTQFTTPKRNAAEAGLGRLRHRSRSGLIYLSAGGIAALNPNTLLPDALGQERIRCFDPARLLFYCTYLGTLPFHARVKEFLSLSLRCAYLTLLFCTKFIVRGRFFSCSVSVW